MIGFYITKPNDTLQRLAAKFYGDWTVWKVIYDRNFSKLKDFAQNQFPSGISLEIPEINLLDETHIVVEGDTYESISTLYYGSESFSETLKRANSSIILTYHIGKEILIPSLIQNRNSRNA